MVSGMNLTDLDRGLLRAVGVDMSLQAVYVALLQDPSVSREELADLATGELGTVLDQLHAIGLVVRSDSRASGVDAVRPDRAVMTLVHARRRQLTEQIETIDRTSALAERLQAGYDRGREAQGEGELPEILRGPDDTEVALTNLMRGVARELCSLQPGPTKLTRHEAPPPRDLDMLARGIGIRTVYSPVYLSEPGAMDVVDALVEAGEQARVRHLSAMPMLLVDGEVAVLPRTAESHPSEGALLVRSSAVVNVCQRLFELLWASSLPYGRDVVERQQDDWPDELVALLAMGLQDEAVARRLGVSVRTVRRRVRGLMDELGCATRTQLGVQLAVQGRVAGAEELAG